MTEPEKQALAIYAMMVWDPCDALDELKEAGRETLELLRKMLTTENPNQSSDDRELNALWAPIVERRLAS